jgi:hypothetical protein
MTEAEVQAVICRWFRDRGYTVDQDCLSEGGNKLDVVARSRDAEWRVEVKGDYDANPAQYNVNFDTGIGQLVKSITSLDGTRRYAIAIPVSRTESGHRLSYRSILPKYSRSMAFEALNIHLLLVRDDESVQVIAPAEVTQHLARMAFSGRRTETGSDITIATILTPTTDS